MVNPTTGGAIQSIGSYSALTGPAILEIVLQGGEQADEAMYYLLHHRLLQALQSRFEPFRRQLSEDFEDCVDDFFLYLREGKDGCSTVPYPSLHTIVNQSAFEVWVLSTFRNYLTMRAAKVRPMVLVSDRMDDGRMAPAMDESLLDPASASLLDDERKLAVAAHLIAYAHQEFYPRDAFLFLRALLTMLNRMQAMPNHAVAQALSMTDVSYRVTLHRMKRRLAKYRACLLQGERLSLDEQHRQMAQQIVDGFDRLYSTLMCYYGQSLDGLSGAAAVRQLRQEYLVATGDLLHEKGVRYAETPSISAFWASLNQFLFT